ncbi:hypothetical protein B0T16DRAFT_315360 [Cercophora newfieldiana]|uniref:Uncharacterized protein n=1 Tax=Cercophora newfieldiana TaxID=92897 RepID=A0AA40D141_9PEZI|nr:hypothetical protein B0T16DRAFT_315360 [Cercophora newfieldiana]
MKFILCLALSPLILAQSLGPSPTESIGCEPHGDHWDCDAPRATITGTVSTTATPIQTPAITQSHDEHEHEHEHSSGIHTDDDDHSTGSLKPSPTESTGCTPHGDHWHCDGKVNETSATTPAATGAVSTTPSSGAGRFGVQEVIMTGAMGLAVFYNIMS